MMIIAAARFSIRILVPQIFWKLLPFLLIWLFFRDESKRRSKLFLLTIPILAGAIISICYLSIPQLGANLGNDIQRIILFPLQALMILTIATAYQVPLKRTLFWAMVLPTTFILADAASSTFSTLLLTFSIFRPHFAMLTATMEILFTLFVRMIYQKQLRLRLTPNNSTLAAFGFLMLYSLFTTFKFQHDQIYVRYFNVQLSSYLQIFGLIALNAVIIYLYTSLELSHNRQAAANAEIQQSKEELQYHRQNMEVYAATRRVKHDLNNQYLVLSGLIQEGKDEEALAYLQRSQSDLEQEDKFYTPNFTLNYVLNEKTKQAAQQGVALQIYALLPESIQLESDILAVVLGNLLDNAIAAAARNPREDKKQVDLTLKTYNGNIMLEVRNAFDPTEVVSRKERKTQGLGIRNIKRLVSESNGLYHQEIDGDQYLASVVFLDSF